MPSPAGTPGSSEAGQDTHGLGRTFVLILLIQVVVVAALYWFGRHFS
jgi:hypothetical protein